MSETTTTTSMAAKIRAALEPMNMPIAQRIYEGDAEMFLTFNMNAMPDAFGDDGPTQDVWMIQVHLFAPFTQNTSMLRRSIRNAIHGAGFTYPEQIDASETVRAADGTEQHIVFQFEGFSGVSANEI